MENEVQAEKKKRARWRGRGCVVERRPGVWRVIISLGRDPLTGKPTQKSETVSGTRNDAKKRLTAMLKDLDDGKIVRTDRITVGGWLDDWYARFVVPGMRLNSAAAYANALKRLKPIIGSKQLQKLQRADVTAALLKLTASGLGSSTVRLYHTCLQSALSVAMEQGLIVSNPSARAKGLPKPKATNADCMTPQEAMAYRVASKSDPFMHTFISLALATGARQSELLALRREDIDTKANTIRIERQLLRPQIRQADGTFSEPIYGPPKSGGTRVVRVDAETMIVLAEHAAHQRKVRMAAGPRYHDAGLVFGREPGHLTEREPDALGWPLRQSVLRDRFKAMAKAAKLRVVHLHTLRHTHATWLLGANTPVADVAARLGHSPVVLLNTYAHAVPRHEDAGIAAVGAMLYGK
jgi:integrase